MAFMTMDCHNSINTQSWNKNIILVAIISLTDSDISKIISIMMMHVQVSKLRYSLSLIIWSKMVCIPNAFWLKYFSIILASNIPKMVIMALMMYKKIASLIILIVLRSLWSVYQLKYVIWKNSVIWYSLCIMRVLLW